MKKDPEKKKISYGRYSIIKELGLELYPLLLEYEIDVYDFSKITGITMAILLKELVPLAFPAIESLFKAIFKKTFEYHQV